MSLLFSFENCSLISHEAFINKIYNDVASDNGEHSAYKINPKLFELNVPYKESHETVENTESKRRRRKIINKTRELVAEEHKDEYDLIQRISGKSAEFLKLCQENNTLNTAEEKTTRSNERLKEFLNHWQTVQCSYSDKFSGGNASTKPIIYELNGEAHIIPANCKFSLTDIQSMEQIPQTDGYDLIVIDPPWWNKYIRRSRGFNRENSYQMLSNEHIASIPIDTVVQPNKTLIAIWCTNAPSMIEAVKKLFFPKWRLKLLATWYWIKVTKSGELICNFDLPLKKQPFERIFIACHEDSTHDFKILDEKLIYSVPSSIHSHKPPLQDLLRPFIKDGNDISCLEIFARYLLPNCTSIGLEVLKLQNLQLFQKEEKKFECGERM